MFFSKSEFFCRRDCWGGRITEKPGYRFEKWNLSGSQNCLAPHTAGELYEYVYTESWISSTLPRLANRGAPPTWDARTDIWKGWQSETAKCIVKTNFAMPEWCEEKEQAFQDFQQQIRDAVLLAHQNQNMTLCVHTDASDKYWVVCATEFLPSKLKKPIDVQGHR